MICPRCGSNNVNVNVINEVYQKPQHGVLWWIFIGWWWRILWFIFFGMWYILWRALRGGKKTVNVQRTMCVCQTCGHSWERR